MDELDIVVQFAKLWGIETADSRLDENKYTMMEGYDSAELLDLLMGWKDEYLQDKNAVDTSEFFDNKIIQLMKENMGGE